MANKPNINLGLKATRSKMRVPPVRVASSNKPNPSIPSKPANYGKSNRSAAPKAANDGKSNPSAASKPVNSKTSAKPPDDDSFSSTLNCVGVFNLLEIQCLIGVM